MEVTCLICDRFDDCAVEVSSLDDTGSYLLALLTEIDFDSSDVLCFGCHGKLTVSTSFLKMCQLSKKCMERKQQLQSETNSLENDLTETPKDYQEVFKEEYSDAGEIETVPKTSFTDMEAFGVVEEHKPSDSFVKTIVSKEISLEILPKYEKHLTTTEAVDRNIKRAPECEICSKKFKSLRALKSHSNLHLLDKRRWQCEICQQKCHTKAKLKRHHDQLHTGKKTFDCIVEGCGYKGSNNYNLNRHLLSHQKRK